MSRKINFHDLTNGLKRIDFPFFDSKIEETGIKLIEIFTLTNDTGSETDVYIYKKDDQKLIRIYNEVETASEGTLCFSNYYSDENLYDFIKDELIIE